MKKKISYKASTAEGQTNLDEVMKWKKKKKVKEEKEEYQNGQER